MKTTIELSEPQHEFYTSDKKYTLFCGGLGSGKTFAGAVWAARMVVENPGVTGLITANSYRQLSTATLPEFFKVLESMGIPFKYRKNAGEIEVYNTVIYAVSMEKYDLLRGLEAGWAWSDECAFYKKEAFDVMIGRLRAKGAPCTWKGTTTPAGFNWLYTSFVESPLPKSCVITSKTEDNVQNLGEGYLETLRAQYDSKLIEQELEGSFVNLTSGKVYYSFDRRQHVKSIDERNNLIFVGLDFNVDPLCGVFCFQQDHKIYVSNEIYLRDSNTFQAAKEIVRRYPFHPVKVVCDETGNRRKSSAKSTDHQILRDAYLDVIKFKNPEQKDRFNNINRLLDHKMLFIDPRCKNLIADLEKLTYDNKDDMLGHITDALGYACWHLNPLKKPRRPAKVRYY